MSTTFYTLTPPVTAIRVQSKAAGARYNEVILFINRQHSGKLWLTDDEMAAFLPLFRGIPLVRRTAGPDGPVYETLVPFPDNMFQVIDEYNDLIDIEVLRLEMEKADASNQNA